MIGAKRIAISKKTRFDVFKRDGFCCQYCGSTPPDVILHVDHINPAAGGGNNNADNLVTSCVACNLGKGATPLSVVPKSLKDRALEVAEREEQIRGYSAILQDRADRIEDQAWMVAAALEGKDFLESYNRAKLASIKRFAERMPLALMLEAAEVTRARWVSTGERAFRCFCGICWARIREAEYGTN